MKEEQVEGIIEAIDSLTEAVTYITQEEYFKLKGAKNNMKPSFKAIVGNPPFQGKAELHQRFFNKGVSLLKDGGVITFVQPATPYFNKKESIRTNAKLMIENVKKYKTDVKIISGSVFKDAGIFTSLAITTLVKEMNPLKNLMTYQDETGNVYSNINVDAVNMLEMNPILYKNAVKKVFAVIERNGSLYESTTTIASDKKLYVQKVRGHIGNADFYTLISKNKEYWKLDSTSNYGIKVKSQHELDSLISYLTSFVARFCLSIYKFNGNNHMGEFRSVPIVPLNVIWDDQQLCKYFGITKSEFAEITRCIPKFYD